MNETSKILITGISGKLGQLLAARLHRDSEIIGIDRRPFRRRPKDVDHNQIDIRRKKAEDIFRTQSIAAVFHMGIIHDPRKNSEEHHTMNLIGTQKILDYVERYRIPKLVFLSSANIYGARATNSQFLNEESPLMAATSFHQIRDLVSVDMLVNSFFWKHPEVETVILRPVHIIGDVSNAPSNYLRLPVVPTILGFDPMVQVIHEEDVVEALTLALRPGIRGVFNIVGPSPVPLSQIIAILGKPNLRLPLPVFRPTLERLWKLKLTSFPPPEIDFIRFTCMVDGGRANRVLEYKPLKSLRETLEIIQQDDIYHITR
ncbi:MAG: SDR family oxidoreductase [Myxococcales bacterium]|nr:SDR family oxidoreductase [Myxococcales bacterium]